MGTLRKNIFSIRNKYLNLIWKIKKNREEKRGAERERKKQVCLRGEEKEKGHEGTQEEDVSGELRRKIEVR